jgi:amino acid transporter
VKSKPTHHGWGFLGVTTGLHHHPTWYAITLAGLLGAYTLVGFELAADMAEETVNARFTVPRAVIAAVAGAAVLGMVALIGFTLAIPDLKTAQESPLPLLTIANYWLPSWVVKVFIGFVIFSMFAINVIGAAAQSRLVYSMARDNMMPFSKALRRVNARTQTPIVALVTFGVVDIGFMIYGYNQASSFDTLVGSTAIIPFIIYFLITVAYAIKRRVIDSVPGAFNLGRWAPLVIVLVLGWTIALIAALSLPKSFHGSDKVIGGAAAVALLWYVTVLHWRLRRGEAGVRPMEEMLDSPDSA